MRRICVYCGSNRGGREIYSESATALAETLVANDLELVYGGSSTGIMGVVADAVLERGGKAHGVLPKSLQHKELAHPGLTELHITESMHQRKSLMADLADGFIALPGGFGTLEELIEITTWGQLQFHEKPCGVLNVDGYYDQLLAFLDHAESEGFIRAENRRMLLADDSADGLLQQFRQWKPSGVEKWTELPGKA